MSFEVHPSVLIGVGALAAVWIAAVRATRTTPTAGHVAAFAAALATILVALEGPVDALADERSFTAHMLQHLLLTYVMPPLLLLGLPATLLRQLVRPRAIAAVARVVTHPLVALGVYNAVLVVIHFPGVFERMVRDPDVHIALHVGLMAAGTILWWPLLSPLPELPRLSYPAQMLYLFLLLGPMAAVAAPITLSPTVLYPWYLEGPHPGGLSPLADQIAGGLLMWVGAGCYLIAVFSVIFFRWAQHEDRDEPPVGARLVLARRVG